MSRLVLLAIAIALFPTLARAEIPPLPKERLVADADLIVTGTVIDVQAKVVKAKLLPGQTGVTEYRWTIRLADVAKGRDRLGDKAETVTVVGERYTLPANTSGSAGHRSNNTTDYVADVKQGATVTVYARSQDGEWKMLSPNGFDVIKQEKAR
ncbi:MAG: hypothetical protein ACAI43_12830 [Phycisphaerae bacterium]|nr:hypothetical protein [Tepidisphaeraceae bacterium]